MTTDSIKCNRKYLFIHNYYTVSLICGILKNIEYIETKSRMVVYRGWEWRKYRRVGRRVQIFHFKDLI